jgi:hypothetical protein
LGFLYRSETGDPKRPAEATPTHALSKQAYFKFKVRIRPLRGGKPSSSDPSLAPNMNANSPYVTINIPLAEKPEEFVKKLFEIRAALHLPSGVPDVEIVPIATKIDELRQRYDSPPPQLPAIAPSIVRLKHLSTEPGWLVDSLCYLDKSYFVGSTPPPKPAPAGRFGFLGPEECQEPPFWVRLSELHLHLGKRPNAALSKLVENAQLRLGPFLVADAFSNSHDNLNFREKGFYVGEDGGYWCPCK